MRIAFPRRDKYLSVADPSRLRGLSGSHRRRERRWRRDDDLDFDLGQEIDDIFRSAIKFSVALLAAKAFHLCDGDP